MLNVVESFSGIGAQTEALKRAGIDHHVANIVEWETGALYAYDIIHNGPQNIKIYRHHTKESLVRELSSYSLSNDGKNLLTKTSLIRMSMIQLKSILYAIERNNNLVDIRSVHSSDLPGNIDLFTYSFPCQDLSVSSNWWNNDKGINRESGGQSSLLWEVERILIEFSEENKPLPKFLMMENVSAILSKKHIDNFKLWLEFLEDLGYYNKTYTLSSLDFGVPQSRERTYMISIFVDHDEELKSRLDNYFWENNLENIQNSLDKFPEIGDYLRLDYSNPVYLDEAIKSTPNFTPSRKKIYEKNITLAVDDKPAEGVVARTVTTKQDRHPNSGLIKYTEKSHLYDYGKYRNITPREAFLLMGFTEDKYDDLMENNIEIRGNKFFLPDSKLYQLAGNSIVVDVLVQIFKQIEDIHKNILSCTPVENCNK